MFIYLNALIHARISVNIFFFATPRTNTRRIGQSVKGGNTLPRSAYFKK